MTHLDPAPDQLLPARSPGGSPEKVAVVMAESAAAITYGALEDRIHRLSTGLVELGLGPGDHVAALMENRLEWAEIIWAARRSGFHLTPINTHLTASEVRFIIEDCAAS